MPDAVTETTPQSTRMSAPRPWIFPRVVELPKLSQLTLASAIGGGGGTTGGGSTVFGLLLAIGLLFGSAACAPTRDDPTEPGATIPPISSQVVSCTAHRDTGSLTCEAPSAAPGTGTYGDQGVVVGLRSTGVSYDGFTDILSATVTVQNLSNQPMGTTDGTTLAGGVNVFFVAGPIGTLGQTILLPNIFDLGTFTGAGQPYFHYDEVLQPQGISAGQPWQFYLGGANDFTFSVLVSANVPAVNAFLSWSEDPVAGSSRTEVVTGYGSDGLALFGDAGMMFLMENGTWKAHFDPFGYDLSPIRVPNAVVTGPKEAFRVAYDGNEVIRYWDGISWRTITGLPGAAEFFGYTIAAPVPGKLYVGFINGLRLFTVDHSADGGTWSTPPDPTGIGASCQAATATAGLLYCAFPGGNVYSFDGTSWTARGASAISVPSVIVAANGNDIWVYGSNALKHWDGINWTSPAIPPGMSSWFVYSATASATGEAFFAVLGSGSAIWHWDGSALSADVTGLQTLSVWGRNADTVYTVGEPGKLLKRQAGVWTWLIGQFGPASGSTWRSVYVGGADDIFMAGGGHKVYHWDGLEWSFKPTAFLANVYRMWGTSSSNLYAVGAGYGIEHYDGNSWSAVGGIPGFSAIQGISGTSANDIWAVGVDYGGGSEPNIVHWNGSNWSAVAAPDPAANLTAVWARTATSAFAVGQGGVAYRWDGTSWVVTPTGTGWNLNAVWARSANDAWAVGDGGTILHWNGTAWADGGPSCSGDMMTDVWGRSATEVYATSDNGKICFYNGTSWVGAPHVNGASLYALGASPNGSVVRAVGGQVWRAAK